MPDLAPLHALHAPPVPLESACHAVIAHYSSDVTQGRAFLDGVEDAVPLDCQIIVYDKRNGRARRFYGPGSHTSAEIYNFKVDGIAAGQPGTASATGVWGPTPGNA